jgi:hypothetical protein
MEILFFNSNVKLGMTLGFNLVENEQETLDVRGSVRTKDTL